MDVIGRVESGTETESNERNSCRERKRLFEPIIQYSREMESPIKA